MLHKKSGLTYKTVRERYEHFRARCTQTKKKKESGCVVPLKGEGGKCIIKIVPLKTKCSTFQLDKRCEKKRIKKRKTRKLNRKL